LLLQDNYFNFRFLATSNTDTGEGGGGRGGGRGGKGGGDIKAENKYVHKFHDV
jgi:hypothetical protein